MFRNRYEPWKLNCITDDGIAIYHTPDYFYEIVVWQEEIYGELYTITESSAVLRDLSQLTRRVNEERYKLYERLRHETHWTEWQGDDTSPRKSEDED